jgi:hypothetical protein
MGFYDLTDVARGCGLGMVSPDLSWGLRPRHYAVAAFGGYECSEKYARHYTSRLRLHV